MHRALAFLLLAFLLSLPAEVSAQTATATLLGTVTDAQSAVIPGARVTARHKETGVTRTAAADAAGDYEIPALAIGPYSVRVEQGGFAPQTFDMVLRVGQRARLDVQLQVGAATTAINVEATPASLLATEQAVIGQVMDNRRVMNLPLNGRNFYQLAALTPGAVFIPSQAGASTRSNFVAIFLGGSRARKTAFYLDGLDITETQFGGTYINPSIDAVNEFKVQTANISAEYGRSGANINTTIKSGANAFHGTGFEFLRDDAVSARNFFSRGGDVLKRSQFGGTFGGPIRKDRSFFFLNMEGTRQRSSSNSSQRAPTEAMKRGVFPYAVYDPMESPRVPFANNTIPASRFSPPAQYFLRWMPAANSTDSAGLPAYNWNPVTRVWQNTYNVRTDHNIGSRNTLFARYSHMDLRQTEPSGSPMLGDYPPVRVRAQNGGFGYTRILRAGMLNEFRAGYNRSHLYNRPIGEGTDYTTASGIRGFATTAAAYPAFPDISLTNYVSLLGLAQDQRPKRNRIDHWQLNDNFSFIHRAHSMKAGIEFRHQKATFIVGNRAQGEFFFNGTWTGAGDAFADYLLGLPNRVRRAYPMDLFGVQDNFIGAYFQDDWKVRKNLTLNLGVRWESNPFYKGIRNQMTAFDFATGKLIVASQHGQMDLTAQQVSRILYPQFADAIVTSEQMGLPVSVRPADRRDWAPRAGLAWRPRGKETTVIRAAYGIFYDFADTNFPNGYAKVPPFIWNEDMSISQSGRPTRFWTDPFLGVEAATGGGTASLNTSQVQMRNAYSQQWNLTVQHALRWNMAAEAAYVGQKGNRLEISQNFNDCPPSPASCTQQRRPYPRFAASTKGDFDAQSIYHSLQTKLERRSARGVSFLASYVWSKSLDNSSNGLGGSADQNNLRYNRGLSDNDIAHRFVSSVNYALPFGQGLTSRPLKTLAAGWEVSGILTLQAGLPFTVSINSDRANIGRSGLQRPNPRAADSPFGGHALNQWFDTREYDLPAVGTFGALGRNTLRGDGVQNIDFSLLKNFRIREQKAFQFRAEFFNLFNHPNFGLPVAVMPSTVPMDAPVGDPRRTPSRFGTVNSAGDPRIIQFGFKFLF